MGFRKNAKFCIFGFPPGDEWRLFCRSEIANRTGTGKEYDDEVSQPENYRKRDKKIH